MTDDKKPAQSPYLTTLAEIAAAGLPLPVPLQAALKGDPMPLAIGFHDMLTAYAETHGYAPEHIRIARRAVGKIVYSRAYLNALSADTAMRHDCDGNAVSPVSPEDRLGAQVAVLALAVDWARRDMKKVLDKLDVLASKVDEPTEAPPSAKIETAKPGAPAPAAIPKSAKPVITVALTRARDLGATLDKAKLSAAEIMRKRAELRGGAK